MGVLSQMLTHTATGAAALSSSLAPDTNFVLVAVKLHLSAAGGAAESFTITTDATDGEAYDALLFSQNMNSETDVIWVPEAPIPFKNGDEIDFAWTNTNTRTWGLQVFYRKEL